MPFQHADQTVLPMNEPSEPGESSRRSTVALPFPFEYNGRTFNSIYVYDDGYIQMPGTRAYIDVYYGGVSLDAQSSVRTAVLGSGADQQLLIEWRDVVFSAEEVPDYRISFTALLRPDGSITVNYKDLGAEAGNNISVGLIDWDIWMHFVYQFGTPIVADNRAITFRPPGA